MKKFLAIILALLSLFVCLPVTLFTTTVSAATSSGNMIINPGFEAAGDWSPSDNTWKIVSAENGVTPVEGSKMMKVCATTTSICPGTRIAVKPHTNYVYTVKIYRSDLAGVAYVNLIDGYSNADIAGSVTGSGKAGEWVTATINFYSGERTAVRPRMVINNAPSGKPVYFDDFSLVPVDSAYPDFPQGQQGVNVKTSFTAASDSTKADFFVANDGKLYMSSFGSKGDDKTEYLSEAVPVALVDTINNSKVSWVYESYAPVEIERGVEHTVTYKSADGKYKLRAVITQRQEVGPLEFNQYITGLTSKVSLSYNDAVSANIKLELKDGDVAVLNRFSRSRVNDGSDPYFYSGDIKETLKAGSSILTSVENHYTPVASLLPYQVIDINGDHGVYIGHYWSFGKMLIRMNNENEIAVSDFLDVIDTRYINREKGEELAVPGFFIGAYDGDIDDGSNDMKHWFWEYKITRSIYENEGEPYISMGIVSNTRYNMDTQFNVWPDFADYVNVIKHDYGWTVPKGYAPRQDIAREDLWLPDAYHGTVNGVPYMGMYEALQEQLKKDDSDNRVYYSLYMADTYMGVDIGTKEGRELQLQALKDRMRPENNDYGIGYDYWRSDFDVEQSYDYDDHEGLLYILDSMIEYSEDFRYEHCMGAGSLKDFTTLERMAFMTTEDTGQPFNHRVSLYQNSYMIHPVQMKADLNLTVPKRTYAGVKPVPAEIVEGGKIPHTSEDYFTYAVRTSLLGSSMLCIVPDGFNYNNNMNILETHFGLYKDTIRPILRDTSVYHILPTPTGSSATDLWYWNDWDGIQYFNHEINEGIVYLFKENASAPSSKVIKLKGLEETKLYDLTFMDRTNLNVRMTGAQLMNEGINVTGMTTRYDSEMIFIKELNNRLEISAPNKTVFHKGEALDLTGMEITAYYYDGTSKKLTDYTTEGYEPNTVGTQNITVTADGISGNIEVEVKEHFLTETSKTPATFTNDGAIKEICTYCSHSVSTTICKANKIDMETEFVYNTVNRRPEVDVYDSKGNKLSYNIDYSVEYPSTCRDIGVHTLKVILKGNYSGTKEVKYTINPMAVKNLEVTGNEKDSLSISWSRSFNCTGYRVYLYNKATGSYKTAISSTQELSAQITGLASGTDYKIGVKAYKQLADGSILYSAMSEITGTTNPLAPSKVTVGSRNATSIKLTWPKAVGATGYRVYKYDSKTGTYKTVATTSNLSYTVKELNSATQHKFRIKSYTKLSDGTTIWSGYRSFSAYTAPKAPSKLTVSSRNTSSIKLSWPKVTGATGYRIYKYDPQTGTYKTVATTTSLSYTVKSLKSATNYKFRIKSYKKLSDGTTVWSGYRSLSAATRPIAPSISSISSPSKGKVTLKWTNIARESGYQIYYATSKTGTYKLLDTTTVNDVSETCTGLTSGRTYYFKVRSYKLANNVKIYSSFSPAKAIKIK